MTTGAESRWTLQSAGNRVMWAVAAAFLTWLLVRGALPALVVGAIVFAVLTAIASTRRR
jgi:hypothetical protein